MLFDYCSTTIPLYLYMCTAHHSTCRCCCSPGIEPAGCAGQPAHGGSWEPWDHFPPPGCRGSPTVGDQQESPLGNASPVNGKGSQRSILGPSKYFVKILEGCCSFHVGHLSIRELQQQVSLSRSVVLEELGWNPDCIRIRNPHTCPLRKKQTIVMINY